MALVVVVVVVVVVVGLVVVATAEVVDLVGMVVDTEAVGAMVEEVMAVVTEMDGAAVEEVSSYYHCSMLTHFISYRPLFNAYCNFFSYFGPAGVVPVFVEIRVLLVTMSVNFL